MKLQEDMRVKNYSVGVWERSPPDRKPRWNKGYR